MQYRYSPNRTQRLLKHLPKRGCLRDRFEDFLLHLAQLGTRRQVHEAVADLDGEATNELLVHRSLDGQVGDAILEEAGLDVLLQQRHLPLTDFRRRGHLHHDLALDRRHDFSERREDFRAFRRAPVVGQHEHELLERGRERLAVHDFRQRVHLRRTRQRRVQQKLVQPRR